MSNKQQDEFFSELGNTKPFFKAGLEGFAGSGKSYTSAEIAIGLHKRIKSKKPVVWFDTERASKFLKPTFDKAKIKVLVKESRSMADLKETMERCRQGLTDVMIIDSISHVWENFLQAYKRKKGNRTFISFEDWGIIKPTWKLEFSDPFVNDPYHIIMCGRAGFEYEEEFNEEKQKRELHKSGIKMRAETETAYEPDILVLMERVENVLDRKKREIYREATVVKSRDPQLDGKVFRNPTFEDFQSAIDLILKDPQPNGHKETDAAGLFVT